MNGVVRSSRRVVLGGAAATLALAGGVLIAGCGFGAGGSGSLPVLGAAGPNGPGGSPDGLAPVASNQAPTGHSTTQATQRVIAFATDIRPILERHCTSCHAPGGTQAASPLDSYSAVVHGVSQFGYRPDDYVTLGDPDQSLLIAKLLGTAGGVMPPTGALPAAEIDLVRKWIESGAVETAAGVPARIVIVGGDGQTGDVGVALPGALTVSLLDGLGGPVASSPISFAVTSGAGTFSSANPSTDGSGTVRVTFTPGAIGPIVVAATAQALANLPVTFNLTGVSATAPRMSIAAGDNQTGTAGSALPTQLAVRLVNPDGTAASNLPVTFTVTAGGGRVSATNVNTDGQGFARTTLTLGTVAGTNNVTATASNVNGSPVTFRATGRAGAAARITLVSGNGQSGGAGSTLAAPLVAAVRDVNGNAVANFTVGWSVTAGGGQVVPGSPRTNASGLVQATFTLGAAGANTVAAVATNLGGSPLAFAATAASPTSWSYVADVAPLLARKCTSCHGPGGSQSGASLTTYAAVVNGMTRFNYTPNRYVTAFNPAASLLITKVKGTSGGGIMPPPTSGFLTPAEIQMLSEWVEQGARQTIAGPPAKLLMVSGNNQSGPVGSLLPQPLVVAVTDAQDRPVAGLAVPFAIAQNDGRLSGTSVLTDELGRASVRFTLGLTVGGNAVVVSMALTGSPATFTATGTPSSFSGQPLAGSAHPLDQAALIALRGAQVEPVPVAGDSEFLRRVTADLTGRLPTEADVTAFLADTDPAKREAAIDRLLATTEFAVHWTTDVMGPWLSVPPTVTIGGVNTVTYGFDAPIVSAVLTNVPLPTIVTNLATGTEEYGQSFFGSTMFNPDPTVRADKLIGAFTGMPTSCARCHDNPLTSIADDPQWTQDDNYGLYAFFAESNGQATKIDRAGRRFGGPVQPRWVVDGYAAAPAGMPTLTTPVATRRATFAQLLIASKAFARGTSHRIWAEIAQPLLDPDTFIAARLQAVTSPTLLDALEQGFRAQNGSLKGFLKFCMTSRLYQLTSAGTTAPDAWQGRHVLRRHHSEVMENGSHQLGGTPLAPLNNLFRANFGYPNRTGAIQVRSNAVNLAQALFQLNGAASTPGQVRSGASSLGALANQVNANQITLTEAITRVVRAGLARDPSPAELNAIMANLVGTTRERLEDVAVAVGATAEFSMR